MKPRIAFLTGQSDPARCTLSPAQSALLAELQAQAPGVDCIALNYPWRADSADWRPVPLWRASLANARQYLAARRGGEPALPAARQWLFEAPRSLLLVGSCGLSLLDALLREADQDLRSRVRLIAYGPVGPHWPSGVDGHVLLGRRDWVARLLGPCTFDGAKVMQQTLACGHMDYLQRPKARAAVLAAACTQLDWLRGESRDASSAASSDDRHREPRDESDAA